MEYVSHVFVAFVRGQPGEMGQVRAVGQPHWSGFDHEVDNGEMLELQDEIFAGLQ